MTDYLAAWPVACSIPPLKGNREIYGLDLVEPVFFFRFGTINTGQADVTLVLLVNVYFFSLTTWTMAQSG